MKLERMDDFFAARLKGYDGHMLTEIEGAGEFYPYTAALLPPERTAFGVICLKWDATAYARPSLSERLRPCSTSRLFAASRAV